MHDDGSNEVGVGLELFNFLHGVIVIDSQMEVIRPAHDPLLLQNESHSSDRIYWGFYCADWGLH